MSRYSRGYIQTHDIDWFCCVPAYPIHVGSCGGKLPSFARDRDINRRLQSIVDYLPEEYDTDWNREYVLRRLERNTNNEITPELFAENFLYFARRGFYSFYRDIPWNEDNEGETYSLIAWPNNLMSGCLLNAIMKAPFTIVASREIQKRIRRSRLPFEDKNLTFLENIPILDYLKE